MLSWTRPYLSKGEASSQPMPNSVAMEATEALQAPRTTRSLGKLAVKAVALALTGALIASAPGNYGQNEPLQPPACPNYLTQTATFNVGPASTDGAGIETYTVDSKYNGCEPQTIKVLQPTKPAPGVAHNVLITLPVQADNRGGGLGTVQALDYQNKFNLTVVEPSFSIDPWYANNPLDPNEQQETYLADYVVPWIRHELMRDNKTQIWLLGFSKSGIGAQDLILRNPRAFTLAASWDAPETATAADQFGPSSLASYGTQANFSDKYQLSASFLAAHRAPFMNETRIWTAGGPIFGQADNDYNRLLGQAGIRYGTASLPQLSHNWDPGWVRPALEALSRDSLLVPAS